MKQHLLLLSLFTFIGISQISGAQNMEILNQRERSIAKAAAFAAVGNQPGLRIALSEGLSAGCSVNELKEVLVQLYAYCGFPRSLNALNTYMALLQERGNRDEAGRLPDAPPAGRSIDYGTENQTRLCGQPVRGAIYDFAPAIDEYLKAHLFGDIFSRNNLEWRVRELATIAMLAAMDGVQAQLRAHIAVGQRNGLTPAQTDEILRIVRDEVKGGAHTSPFPFGAENTAYAQYFIGKSYLAQLTAQPELNVPVANVTFEPACRNNWHKHSGGQLLIAVGGAGLYQERGKAARALHPGDVVEIPANVEHWHGATPGSWFSHLAVTCNPQSNRTTWLEPVDDAAYQRAADVDKQ